MAQAHGLPFCDFWWFECSAAGGDWENEAIWLIEGILSDSNDDEAFVRIAHGVCDGLQLEITDLWR